MITRRGLLAAPAVVAACSLMPVRSLEWLRTYRVSPGQHHVSMEWSAGRLTCFIDGTMRGVSAARDGLLFKCGGGSLDLSLGDAVKFDGTASLWLALSGTHVSQIDFGGYLRKQT
jgi:hypothetical protein